MTEENICSIIFRLLFDRNNIAIIIALFALCVSLGSAWYAHFKPAEIIANLPYIQFWAFSSKKDGNVTDRKITPALWLANIGARPILIEDIRIIFRIPGREEILSYPVNSVPEEAVTSPSEFHDYGRLTLGGPFRGFQLTSEKDWFSSYNFSIRREKYESLKGDVNVIVQIKSSKDRNWKTIHSDVFEFGSHPYHLRMPQNAGAVHNPVYSSIWKKRERGVGK